MELIIWPDLVGRWGDESTHDRSAELGRGTPQESQPALGNKPEAGTVCRPQIVMQLRTSADV